MTDETFAVYLKKVRKDMQMTQVMFAKWLNVPFRNLCSWERGRGPSRSVKALIFRLVESEQASLKDLPKK